MKPTDRQFEIARQLVANEQDKGTVFDDVRAVLAWLFSEVERKAEVPEGGKLAKLFQWIEQSAGLKISHPHFGLYVDKLFECKKYIGQLVETIKFQEVALDKADAMVAAYTECANENDRLHAEVKSLRLGYCLEIGQERDDLRAALLSAPEPAYCDASGVRPNFVLCHPNYADWYSTHVKPLKADK